MRWLFAEFLLRKPEFNPNSVHIIDKAVGPTWADIFDEGCYLDFFLHGHYSTHLPSLSSSDKRSHQTWVLRFSLRYSWGFRYSGIWRSVISQKNGSFSSYHIAPNYYYYIIIIPLCIAVSVLAVNGQGTVDNKTQWPIISSEWHLVAVFSKMKCGWYWRGCGRQLSPVTSDFQLSFHIHKFSVPPCTVVKH